jgi:MFS transporter, CP family, cyanate transporter
MQRGTLLEAPPARLQEPRSTSATGAIRRAGSDGRADGRRRLGLLWLAGLNLRLPVLALPPVLPSVHHDLGLSQAGVAALAGLPLLLFALGGVPGALLIGRLGARRVVLVGLVVAGLASALRGAGPSTVALFGATLCMGAGIAGCQPALPSLVRLWFPRTVARATSIWSNGLLMGTILSSSLTLPVVLPLVGGSWQASLAVWGTPALLAAGLLAVATRRAPTPVDGRRTAWWPEWRSPRVWQLGVFQSAGTLIYFGASTFIPDFLHASARPELIAPALAALGLGQLPGSLLVGVAPWRRIARRSTAVVLSAATLGGLGALLLAPAPLFVAAAAVLGACGGAALALALALPPLLAAPAEVPRLSGGVLALGYSVVSLVLFATGVAWDATHVAAVAFVPAALGGAFVLLLATPGLLGRVRPI